jgi:ubiquinone biosynthesis protein
VSRRLGTAVGLWALRERRAGDSTSLAGISRRLRIAAEKLGPTYIKLGQIISSGEGIFPAELVGEFKLCRDRVPAEPFRVVREVVEADLGRPLEEVFRWVDRTPLAAASIAQVHAATLRTGESVVVKVQRPKLVGRIPVTALANPPALVELFAETITEELDFRLEAENMLDVARAFAELGQRHYVIPRPHPTLVTRRVLVMERLDGFRFDDVVGMQGAGLDTEAVVRAGMVGSIEGALIHGIFHGDLHGGNLFVLPDGRTALLDFGITGRLNETKRLAMLRLMMGGSTNDVRAQLSALRDLGALPADADLDEVSRELKLEDPFVDPLSLSGEQLVGELQQVVKALLGFGARMPKELMLFVKNMVFLDNAIATLAPDLDMIDEVAQMSIYFATRHGETTPSTRSRTASCSSAGRRSGRSCRPSPGGAANPGTASRAPLGSPAMRLVVARCTVDYAGRLTAHLPAAVRLIMFKADGCVAVHADGGAYKPLNWMNAPNTVTEAVDDAGRGVWTVRAAKGETLTITLHEILSDTSHEMGVDPGLLKDGVEAHLQELLAANCDAISPGLVLVRREYPTDIGPVDLLCRDADGRAVAIEIKRRGEIDGVEQLARYLEFLETHTRTVRASPGNTGLENRPLIDRKLAGSPPATVCSRARPVNP